MRYATRGAALRAGLLAAEIVFRAPGILIYDLHAPTSIA